MGKDDFSKIPNGGPGIENRLSLLYTHGVVPGLLDMNRLVDVFSTTAARLFGLFWPLSNSNYPEPTQTSPPVWSIKLRVKVQNL